jgi:hypothetical protein
MKGGYHMSWQVYREIIQKDYHIEDDDTVIKIPLENILEVTEKELIFKNKDGEMQKILFEDCVRNFREAFGLPENDKKVKGIGGRYFEVPVGFHELFANDHHIRFYMTIKTTRFKNLLEKLRLWNAYKKEYLEFRALERRLNEVGYSTIDLT